MDSIIDNKTLRESAGYELAKYFRHIHTQVGNKEVLNHLLDSVKSESIPPRVLSLWIRGFADTPSLAATLHFDDSLLVRKSAIKRYGKLLRGESFSETWNAVGTEGLVQLFTELSVFDVACFCRCLGRSATSVISREVRRKRMTELVKALASDQFPDSKLKNSERRPLLRYYANIIPACTRELVQEWQANDNLPAADHFRVCQAHPEMVQQECLRRATHDHKSFDFSKCRSLCQRVPPVPASHYLSRSMQFSMTLLRTLETESGIVEGHDELLQQLAYPLLRRLERRRHSRTIRAEVIQSVLRRLQTRPSACEHLPIDDSGLFGYITRLWGRDPDKHKDTLIAFAELVPRHQSTSLNAIGSSLSEAGQRSYKLLHVLLRHVRHFHIHLEDDNELQNLNVAWPVNIFLSIPKTEARTLLDRLVRLRPAGSFIDWSRNREDSILAVKNLSILQLMLSEDPSKAREQAERLVEDCRRKATTSREQADRAHWAELATFSAISSGSMQVYENTLLWIRRFNKDALTVKVLYNRATIQTVEGVAMLCGIPANGHSMSKADVQQRVQHGNRILLLLLETACMCLREPSFHPHDWQSVFGLFGAVFGLRLERSDLLQDKLGISDDEVYDLVWGDTLEMLLSAEQMGLQDGHEKLGFNQLGGPLEYHASYRAQKRRIRNVRGATLRFVDNLAGKRNALWETYRRTIHPTVVTLPRPWTRGLPIQSLIPFEMDVSGYGQHTPLLVHRAKSVVFVESAFALAPRPADEETRTAIGPFVDDYVFALRFYVHAEGELSAQNFRIQNAWDHALNELSDRTMQQLDATLFWQAVFRRAGIIDIPGKELDIPKRPDPVLPNVDEPCEHTEWNPDPEPDRWVRKPHRLSTTCLDYLLDPLVHPPVTVRSAFPVKESSTVGLEQLPCWEREYVNAKSILPDVREALIAAAVLYINGKHSSHERMLAKPFPSATDVRYPVLFLDDEFLDRQDIDQLVSFVFRRLRHDIPPTLLVSLCKATLERMVEHEEVHVRLEGETFRLLKTLITLDKPETALDLIAQVIVERPNDSSWHRHILTTGLLKSLSARRAKRFLSSLVQTVETKLHEQAERKGKDVTESPSPLIKVTTVKLLAQLLSGAEFLDEIFALDCLVSLLSSSKHLDIRVAIIEAMTSKLATTNTEVVRTKIIAALETHAIPIAAALNERTPMTEEDWEHVEDSVLLPEVFGPVEGPVSEVAPTLQALLRACSTVTSPLKEVLLTRIMLPIVNTSAANNRRWMSLFLQKNGFAPFASSLPPVPVHPSLVTGLVSFTEYVPATLLDLLAETTLVMFQAAEYLSNINKRILESPELRFSNAGKHWLALWNNNGIERSQLWSDAHSPTSVNGIRIKGSEWNFT